MRRARLLATTAAMAMGFAAALSAEEAKPGDIDTIPWDEIDRVLKADQAQLRAASPAEPVERPAAEETRLAVAKPADAKPADTKPTNAKNAPPPAPETPIARDDDPAPEKAADDNPDEVDPNSLPSHPSADTQPAQDEPASPAAAGQPVAPAPAIAAATPDTVFLPMADYAGDKVPAELASYSKEDREAVLAFYTERKGQALLVDKNGFTKDGEALIGELRKADDWGLSANDYKIPALTAEAGRFADKDLATAELQSMLAIVAYGRHARGDRITDPTKQLSSYLDRKPQLVDRNVFLAALAAAEDKPAYLVGLHPRHEQFKRLREKLLELRSATAAEEATRIPDGANVKKGRSDAAIPLIRARLKVTDQPLKPDGTPAPDDYYDDALAKAVVAYKQDNGLDPATTTITRALRKSLNGGPRLSEELLLANMEQWRWMPDDLGATHIEVNVPEFMVRVVKDGAIQHAERIVTGKPQTQTPIFSHKMTTVVFQPSWIVPDSIKVNELLPGLRYGGDPIRRQGLRIERNGRKLSSWDVDWYSSDIRNYHIYQPPGPSNVLGVVKFLFPNKHAVYLHDTPSKSLFNESVRTFSHGCMRVRNPVQLAQVILADDKGWDSATVEKLARSGPADNDIALTTPLPIHVTYFTAWVEDDGTVKTFSDVYGHEKRIQLALAGRWDDIDKNRDHLLPVKSAPVARRRDGDWWQYADRRRRDDGYYEYYDDGYGPPRGSRLKKHYKKPSFFEQLFGVD